MNINRHLFSLGWVFVLIIITAGTCGPYPVGEAPEAPPALGLHVIEVTNPRANLGELVTFSWGYENEDKLVDQTIIAMDVGFGGVAEFSEISSKFDSDDENYLPPDERDGDFEFVGPVTIIITAEDDEGKSHTVAFDITYATDFFMTAEITATATNTNLNFAQTYPDFGYEGNSLIRTINFTQFVGIHDYDGDGIIEDLKLFLNPEFNFRAMSTSVFESEEFGYKQGSAYPLFNLKFQETSDGQTLNSIDQDGNAVPDFLKANAVIFGGAIIYDGTVSILERTDEGPIEVREGETLTFTPIAITVDLHNCASRYGVANTPGDIHCQTLFANTTTKAIVTNVHIANLTQGLVVSSYNNANLLSNPDNEEAVDYTLEPSLRGTANGLVKGFAPMDISPISTNSVFNIGLEYDINWDVPFFPDFDLAPVTTIRWLNPPD